MSFTTLSEVLDARQLSSQAIHYIEGESSERSLPFRELRTRAIGLLRHIQDHGAAPGSELIVLVDRNEQFVDVFWAGVLGNIVLVPLAPGTTDEHRLKFFRVLKKLARPFLCTDQKIFARLAAYAEANGLGAEIERIRPATVFLDQLDDISQPGSVHNARPDDVAFVQYSSGSTSEPKGVALTHRNLMANIAAIADGIDLQETDVGMSWMPLTHDMGLIGFHLTPFVANVSHHLMSTTLFVRRPQLWLIKASEHKASVLCSPNFGYRHFLKTFDPGKAQALDLSHVRIIFNGAEPISISICREFLDALVSCGLRASAMFPVYGLAEASLAVTFPKPDAGCTTVTVNRDTLTIGASIERLADNDPRAVKFVLVGEPVRDCQVRITDDAGAELKSETVGHIQIRGENVSRGYYRDPEATRQAISADGWLDTGDLGFQSADGLAISGRSKEILFVSGQNYYPHDLEAVIERYARIELGKAAVCGVRPENASTDEILAFILHRGELSAFLETAKTVRKCINEHIGIVISHVIPANRIPKTTSGKIQRYLLAESFRQGEYADVLARLHDLAAAISGGASEAHSEIEKNLKEICDAFLTDKPIGVHDNIFELGTSSLTLAQIYQRIEVLYPGQLEVTDFFDYPTVAELAKYLEGRLNAAQA